MDATNLTTELGEIVPLGRRPLADISRDLCTLAGGISAAHSELDWQQVQGYSEMVGRLARRLEHAAADHLRQQGRTWEEIGINIAVSKQAAQQRYARRPADHRADPASEPLF